MNQALQIIEYKPTAAALAELEAKYRGIVFDVATAKGLTEAKAARAEIRGYRVDLEKMRKELKADVLEKGRLIDGEAKRITAELEALEEPIDGQIKAEELCKEQDRQAREEAERAAIQAIQEKIANIRKSPIICSGFSSAQIANALASAEQFEVKEDEFGLYIALAQQAKAEAVIALQKMLAVAQGQEAEKARIAEEREELKRLKATEQERQREAAEREKAERIQREAELKAQEAALRAEREAQAKALQAERVAQEAELKAKRKKEEAELRELREAEESRLIAQRQRLAEEQRKEKEESLHLLLNGIAEKSITLLEKLVSAYEMGRQDLADELGI